MIVGVYIMETVFVYTLKWVTFFFSGDKAIALRFLQLHLSWFGLWYLQRLPNVTRK